MRHLTKYYLIDTHYKSDSISTKGGGGGRSLKKFYDEFCQYVFDINLTYIDDVKHFPLVHNEESNKATIAIALSRLTPYVISEYGADCKDVDLGERLSSRAGGRVGHKWFIRSLDTIRGLCLFL